MKKLVSMLLVLSMSAMMLAGCGSSNAPADNSDAASQDQTDAEAPADENVDAEAGADLKVGVILVGDETESYTLAHIQGIETAAEAAGITEIEWKYNVEESEDCYDAAKALVADGCGLIISNSYGHQDYMVTAAEEFPEVNFVAMTGDFAALTGLDNFFNAFTNVYESRYVSGVVAGMKIAELIEQDVIPAEGYDADGNVKIGYVGAFPYAEVVSGYTAFYLGIKSIVPNVVMDVQYTNSWFDIDGEAAAAETLMSRGCVVIGQHADSTGAPAAVQAAKDNGAVVYSVGYNVDMLPTAPTAALTSATNNWSVYYSDLFAAVLGGTEIPQDWAKGYAEGAVAITDLGPEVAEGTAEKVEEVIAGIKDGSVHVFDTAAFTVDGAAVTTNPYDMSYMDYSTMTAVYEGETVETIVDGYFSESTFRAAPYFTLRIDGITELNAN